MENKFSLNFGRKKDNEEDNKGHDDSFALFVTRAAVCLKSLSNAYKVLLPGLSVSVEC